MTRTPATSVLAVNLQEFTKLPINVVAVADKVLPDVYISTPHKGRVSIRLKEEHYPFLFGSVTQTDRHAPHVISDIRKLDEEAKDFLLTNWLLTLENKETI